MIKKVFYFGIFIIALFSLSILFHEKASAVYYKESTIYWEEVGTGDPPFATIGSPSYEVAKAAKEAAENYPGDPNFERGCRYNSGTWASCEIPKILQNSCIGGYVNICASTAPDTCFLDNIINKYGYWGGPIDANLVLYQQEDKTNGGRHNLYGPAFQDIPPCSPLALTLSISGKQPRPGTNTYQFLTLPASYTLNWTSNPPAARSCSLIGPTGTISSDFNGSKTLSNIFKEGIYNYTFSCSGVLDGSVSPKIGSLGKEIRVEVGDIPPAPTVNLTITPSVIKKGESAVLGWTSSNALSLSINQGIGTVRQQGSLTIKPDYTTSYTITASGKFADIEPGRIKKSTRSIRVIAPGIVTSPPVEPPTEPPVEIPPELPKPAEEKIDLKVDGQDGPLTLNAPATFTLSWNLDRYCLMYGSWLGIKSKAGEEQRTEKKVGNYTYRLYCPGIGSDEVKVNVVGTPVAGGALVPMPVAEASISVDGKNFSSNIRVVKGKQTGIWLSAAYDINGDKKTSRDDTGKWTSALSMGGRCEWNYDLNKGIPVFEATTFDPQDSSECAISLGKIAFNDEPGVYRYGVLRLIQNDGKVSNTGYVNVIIQEPPPPKGPPVVNLFINNSPGPLSLGAPADYTISWEVKDADSCIASDAWNGEKVLSGSQRFVTSSKKELTYTLTCKGKLGITTKSILLKVAELPVCDFSAMPTVLDKETVFIRETALSWKCKYANSCFISPSVGNVDIYGSKRVFVPSTTNYVLTCQNLEGNASFEQSVEVR